MERWKVIPDYPVYAISNHGRLKRIKDHARYPAGRIMSGGIGDAGRHIYSLCNQHGPKTFRASRLVAEAFIPRPLDSTENIVIHADGNPLNNHIKNLRWATHKENSEDRIRHGRSPRGEKNTSAKLSAKDVHEIRDIFRRGQYTHDQLAEKFGVSQSTISRTISRQNWLYV